MGDIVWTGKTIDPDLAWEFARQKFKGGLALPGVGSLEHEAESIIGEMVFSAWSGLPMILVGRDAQTDYGIDFTVQGWSVDVKSTQHPKGRLLHRTKWPTDVFVLVVVNMQNPYTSHVVGWAWKDDFRLGKIYDFRGLGRPVPALEQSQLRPMSQFHEELIAERLLVA